MPSVSRDTKDFLPDIQEGCARIIEYSTGLTRDEALGDRMRIDGILFNLQLIGEAVKQLPDELRAAYPAIPWREIAGMRDVIAHAYFALDLDILWRGVQTDVPVLLDTVCRMLSEITPESE